MLRWTGRGQQAAEQWRLALQRLPKLDDGDAPALWTERAAIYCQLGQWDAAADDMAKAIELGMTGHQVWYELALAHLADGDIDAYRQDCRTVLERFGKTEDIVAAGFTAWSCVLAADAVEHYAEPLRLAERAAAKSPEDPMWPITVGAVLYRAGRLDEAIDRLSAANRLQKTPRLSPAYTWFFLAMAHHHAGNTDEANRSLQEAVEWTEEATQEDIEGTGPELSWNRRLTLKLLRQQAEAMIVNDQP